MAADAALGATAVRDAKWYRLSYSVAPVLL